MEAKEREIDGCKEISTLRRMRSSRKGQLTIVRQELEKHKLVPLEELRSITMSNLLRQFEDQHGLFQRVQTRMLALVRAQSGPNSEEYTTEETEACDQEGAQRSLRENIEELLESTRIMDRVRMIEADLEEIVTSDTWGKARSQREMEKLASSISNLKEKANGLEDAKETRAIVKALGLKHRKYMAEADDLVAKADRDPPPRTVSFGTAMDDSVHIPRLDLPTFDGKQENWDSFWADFKNGIGRKKLTEQDKILYLRNSVKCDEGLQIINTGRNGGDSYDEIVERLIVRYDRPRDTCRTAMDEMISLRHDFTHEGLGKADAVFSNTLAILKRYTDGSIETMLALIWEVIMPQELYQEWRRQSDEHFKPPAGGKLREFTARIRRGMLIHRDNPDRSYNHPPPVSRPTYGSSQPQRRAPKAIAYHIRDSSGCKQCGDKNHAIYQCPTFRALSVEQRQRVQQKLRICNNCLSPEHGTRACPSKRSCRTCGKRHHSLLHRELQTLPGQPGTSQPTLLARPSQHNPPVQSGGLDATTQPFIPDANSPVASFMKGPEPPTFEVPTHHVASYNPCLATEGSTMSFLGTCIAVVEHKGSQRKARAMLDNGSILTFVTKQFVKANGLKQIYDPREVKGFQESATPRITHYVNIHLKIPSGSVTVRKTVKALVVESITGDLPSGPLPQVKDTPHLQGLPLADPNFDRPARVDLLLGIDTLPLILKERSKFSPDSRVFATETAYGWVVSGQCDAEEPRSPRSHICVLANTSDDKINELLRTFLEEESVPTLKESPPSIQEDEQRVEDNFVTTHSRQKDGRFVVQLPRKVDPPELGCSRDQAERRFWQNDRSLRKKGGQQAFTEALWDYAKRLHAEKVPPQDLLLPECKTFYLPTHGVVKEHSTTTKLRVVFDASAASSTGTSLNDQLLPGPNLYPHLVPILLQFRLHTIGMTADIGKMFREIALDPTERDFHRFLMTGEDGRLEDWRMTRLTFGVASSPFLATRVLRQAADLYQDRFPQAAEVLRRSLYVDDCITGAATLDEAKQLRIQLNQLLKEVCMTLRKWRSSSPDLMSSIPDDLREQEEVQILATPKEHHKTLGIHWNTTQDTLHVATPPTSTILHPTKRQIASEIARVFDILGWFAPAVVQLKLLLQQLWVLEVSWDTLVPDDIAQAWLTWQHGQHHISEHAVPRLLLTPGRVPQVLQLHGFADASINAFGGVVYLRAVYTDLSVSTRLLLAKTRVAPISKRLTVPRLELSAALLLSQLLATTAEALHLPAAAVYAWSDSTITLNWIYCPPGGHNAFVTNRVAKLVEKVSPKQWRHVPTESNPADLASRGVGPEQLTQSKLWWNGPEWLSLEPSSWPHLETWRRGRKDNTEAACLVAKEDPVDDQLIKRFSSYDRAIRVYAWMTRWTSNLKHRKQSDRNLAARLTVEEISQAEGLLWKQSQRRTFPDELNKLAAGKEISQHSRLLQVRPVMYQDGLLRVGGRLQKTEISHEQKHPVILHRRDYLAKLICWQLHKDLGHMGPSSLMGPVASRFHIVGCKPLLKAISQSCVTCRRFYARTATQLMGQLPPFRTTPAPPFQTTGIDFAGPFSLRKGYSRKPTWVNGYVCLFVCPFSRAIHLELVMDLTTKAFLAALSRFAGRRGLPALILSDNGTNFVGAHNKVDKAYKTLDLQDPDESLSQYLLQKRITWKHTPARAPHFGGIWEAGVRQMKAILTKILGTQRLTSEQWYTILVEVEAILNSRPLKAMDSPPTDGIEVLTPAHFLIGRSLQSIPQLDTAEQNIALLKHWELCRRLTNDLWKEWSGAYLQLLQRLHRWRVPKQPLRVGEVVLIKDGILYEKSWPLAIIEGVQPGQDGEVRVVTLRSAKGVFTRPITKVVPLLERELAASPPQDVRVQDPDDESTSED